MVVQRPRRAAATVVLVAAALTTLGLANALPASADSLSTQVDASSWYWAEASPSANGAAR